MAKICEDCEKEKVYNHLRPPFIPRGKGDFCESGFCKECYKKRLEDFWKQRTMRPLGQVSK
jgi:hypothetical protein